VDLELELELEFSGELWYWRGPAPFHFITVPPEGCVELRSISSVVSYGWGMIPVTVRIGGREFDTALWPKDGRYIVPVKDVVRKAQGLAVGDTVALQLVVRH
jgi:Domain of unknown function (DUF1905)